jgi:acetyltransferase
MLLESDAVALVSSCGIAYPPHRLVHSGDEAVAAADEFGYPVVLKVVAEHIVHKTDAGGVALGLAGPMDVRAAAERLFCLANTAGDPPQALVAAQAPPGLELILGAARDPELGMAVMLGAGGVLAELLDDVGFRLAPLAGRDARELLGELRLAHLVRGHRGAAALDEEALVAALLAVSRLLDEHPEIAQLDLNPVRLYEHGLLALDARVFVDERTSP